MLDALPVASVKHALDASFGYMEILLGGAALSTLFASRAAISFLVFTLLYTPCIAAVATIRREFNSTLKTVGVVLMQCCGQAALLLQPAARLARLPHHRLRGRRVRRAQRAPQHRDAHRGIHLSPKAVG